MGLRPPLHLGVAAIEKDAFVSLSTKVANFTLLYWGNFNDLLIKIKLKNDIIELYCIDLRFKF